MSIAAFKGQNGLARWMKRLFMSVFVIMSVSSCSTPSTILEAYKWQYEKVGG